jgi:hypothetical protein
MKIRAMIKDLDSKMGSSHFSKNIYGSYYRRRSLGDLMLHYNASDTKMIRALKRANFAAYFCPDINKIVFHRVTRPTVECGPFSRCNLQTAEHFISKGRQVFGDVNIKMLVKYWNSI